MHLSRIDILTLKEFISHCPLLARLNVEQNPLQFDRVTFDTSRYMNEGQRINPLSLLPRLLEKPSSQAIRLYLNFLSNVTTMLINLRQTIEQGQSEPFGMVQSIYHRCQRYGEEEPLVVPEPTPHEPTTKDLPQDRGIVRLQAHWRRRLLQRQLDTKHFAAQCIQARWRGYAVRQRMHAARHLFQHQQQPTFDEIDLAQFDFDEVIPSHRSTALVSCS